MKTEISETVTVIATIAISAVILIGVAALLKNDKVHSILTQGADNQGADNFNTVRQVTVTNSEGDVLFQMAGKITITTDTADNQIEILVEIQH